MKRPAYFGEDVEIVDGYVVPAGKAEEKAPPAVVTVKRKSFWHRLTGK